MTMHQDTFGIATMIAAGQPTPAVVTSAGVVALHDLIGPDAPTSVRAIIDDWDVWCDQIAIQLALSSATPQWPALGQVTLLAPLPEPANVYLAGANYYDHVQEMGGPVPDKSVDEVFHFMVPSASLIGNGHDVVRPEGVEELDWEVELAVVIGRRADHVSVAEALDYVAGYTVANDVSARGPLMFHPIFGLRFLWAKGQATLKPVGPAIVPTRFVPDPGALGLSTLVNGVVRQDASTAGMIWSVAEQIAFLSTRAPLLPGDLILTGTPAGTGAGHGVFLADGDVLTSRIEGIGELTNVVAETRSDAKTRSDTKARSETETRSETEAAASAALVQAQA